MDITTAELEKRMRPGAYSTQGFLGPTESLETVLALDNQTLELLGSSYAQVADELEKVLQTVMGQPDALVQSDYPEYQKRVGNSCLPNLYQPSTIPRFSKDNLPGRDVGYLVGEKLQVFITQYCGVQDCPWGCGFERLSSFDFLILNRQSGEWVTGPGLIVHLIRKHGFFEGPQSPYRVDPTRVLRVLDLIP